MKIYKINKIAMGKEHDELQDYIVDQPEEAVNDIAGQVTADIQAYYDGVGKTAFRKTYKLLSPHNEFIQDYELEVLAIASNNRTAFGDASMNYMEIKMLNRDNMEPEKHILHVNYIDKMVKDTLWHEMGHYYIEKKRGSAGDFLYYQQGMDKYFDDKEELVLHSRDTWNKIIAKYPNIHTLPVDRIKKIVGTYVSNLPQDIGFYGARFPKAVQARYVSFIWKWYVKPNLGVSQ